MPLPRRRPRAPTKAAPIVSTHGVASEPRRHVSCPKLLPGTRASSFSDQVVGVQATAGVVNVICHARYLSWGSLQPSVRAVVAGPRRSSSNIRHGSRAAHASSRATGSAASRRPVLPQCRPHLVGDEAHRN